MSKRLIGKVAIVTGGASGFGKGIATKFVEEGAKVIIADLSEDLGQAAAKELDCTFQHADITKREDWQRLLNFALDNFAALDIVVNNAGTTYRTKPTIEVSDQDFDLVFNVNVRSIYLSCSVLLPYFLEHKRPGSFITISSTAAIRPRPQLAWYNATKGAASNATKSLAVEYAPQQVRFNSVCPTVGRTGLLHLFAGSIQPETALKMGVNNSVPMGRPTTPLDVANACLYLASDEASFITGVELPLAYKIYHEYKLEDLVELAIYEANPDLGGTWLMNRYPGVARHLRSDIPAHIYTFPFEPNPDWSAFYASGPEIREYMKRTAEKYDLGRNNKYCHKVVEAKFNETTGQWQLKVQNGGVIIEDTCDILVSATGHLSRWIWPSIQGLHSFRGLLVHSAKWNTDFVYEGKRVAVIGNGSSAIQIVPQMAKVASQVTNFIRSPTWITPGVASSLIQGKVNHAYSEEEKAHFRENPAALKEYRKKIQHASNAVFGIFEKDSPAQLAAKDVTKKFMLERLGGNEELGEKLIPDWELGCRRPTPGPGYLESFTKPHVALVTLGIEEVTPTGITTVDGKHHEFDVIVCATGFDVSHRPPFPLIGRSGTSLSDTWHDYPEAYLSICVADYPNFFMFGGPNAPVGHGSLLSAQGWTADYILQRMKKMTEEDIKWVVVRPDAMEEFNAYAEEILQTLVWTGGCKSWFKNNTVDGRVTAVWAGSAIAYKEMVDTIRPEDFTITYRSRNRFRFMGTGRTKRELLPHEDLAFYITK
ncbi:hypothetical protein CLAIMM_01747 [Cladophialophora immunda]|nr:hypothetical protein CLAIMM_01747 [Cladophialophora immunda]